MLSTISVWSVIIIYDEHLRLKNIKGLRNNKVFGGQAFNFERSSQS